MKEALMCFEWYFQSIGCALVWGVAVSHCMLWDFNNICISGGNTSSPPVS